MGQGLFCASAAVGRKSTVSAAFIVYNAVQQISGLVIIVNIHYLTISNTIILGIHVLDEGPVVLFAMEMYRKKIPPTPKT